MHNDWKGALATILTIVIIFAITEFNERSK